MAHKVGDKVTVTRGPHAGQTHEIIHVHKDGSGYNVKPHNTPASRNKYRLGAAKAGHGDVKKMKESTNEAKDHVSSNHAMHSHENEAQKKAHAAHMKKKHGVKTTYHGDDEVRYHGPKKNVKKALGNHYGGDHDHAKEEHPHIYKESMLTFEAHSWSYDSGWRKPQAQRKDKFGNIVKDKNVAKNLARKAMKKTKDDEKKPVSELSKDTMKSYKKKVTKRIGQHATGEYHPTDNAVKMDWELDQYQDKARVHKKMRDVAKKKIAAKGKNESTINEIARSMTPMRDIFGKSKAEKDADREKLQKIKKMMNRDKAVAKKSTHPGPNEDVDEACWDSHKQVGYKMKGGRRVPNCVPKNENQNAALQKKLSKSAQSSEKGKAAVTLKKAPFKIPSEKDMKNEVLDSDKARKRYMDKARYSKDRANNSAAANMVRKTSPYKDLKTVQKRDKGMASARRKAIMKFREM